MLNFCTVSKFDDCQGGKSLTQLYELRIEMGVCLRDIESSIPIQFDNGSHYSCISDNVFGRLNDIKCLCKVVILLLVTSKSRLADYLLK